MGIFLSPRADAAKIMRRILEDEMPDIQIARYDAKYRQAVRDCVYETGFGGKSVAPFFEDRELFADLLILYYTDYEPESAFVPLVDGEPAGYLLGCLDSRKCERITRQMVYPEILRNAIAGRYPDVGPVTWRYLWRMALQEIRAESVAAPYDRYPAHLHIDLFESCRRMGIGSRLIEAFLCLLREKGITGVHLGTSSFHTEAIPFYRKLGFDIYGMRRLTSSYFQEAAEMDFYEIRFVKKIS